MEVELPIGLGGFTAYQPLMNSECHDMHCSEAVGAKVHCREGNNPDHQLRSPSITKLNERGGNAKTARMLAWKQPFI
jgi:hypothetical protein